MTATQIGCNQPARSQQYDQRPGDVKLFLDAEAPGVAQHPGRPFIAKRIPKVREIERVPLKAASSSFQVDKPDEAQDREIRREYAQRAANIERFKRIARFIVDGGTRFQEQPSDQEAAEYKEQTNAEMA